MISHGKFVRIIPYSRRTTAMLTITHHRRLRARSRLRSKAEILAILDARIACHTSFERTVIAKPAAFFVH